MFFLCFSYCVYKLTTIMTWETDHSVFRPNDGVGDDNGTFFSLSRIVTLLSRTSHSLLMQTPYIINTIHDIHIILRLHLIYIVICITCVSGYWRRRGGAEHFRNCDGTVFFFFITSHRPSTISLENLSRTLNIITKLVEKKSHEFVCGAVKTQYYIIFTVIFTNMNVNVLRLYYNLLSPEYTRTIVQVIKFLYNSA
jgi:hypothetical protein